MSPEPQALQQVLQTLENAAAAAERPVARLLAVSKTKPVEAIQALAEAGQKAFGENYVQEAIEKIRLLKALDLEWHLIGHLQSNKCRDAAHYFDWVESLDRARLIEPLDRYREGQGRPLDVLIQVNPDGERGKSGCDPSQINDLAALVVMSRNLRLRGLMAIPEPADDREVRRETFRRLRSWFEQLQARYPQADTLSMGMSDDFELAASEGATEVRIGSALFGARR